MVGTADSIRKDMQAIEASTEKMAEELQELYQNYLTLLGTATQRQLILASFHLCTQAYPEAFLKLTVQQREQLQQQLRQLGEDGREQLLKLLDTDDDWRTASIDEMPAALMAALGQDASAMADTAESEPSPVPDLPNGPDSSAVPAEQPEQPEQPEQAKIEALSQAEEVLAQFAEEDGSDDSATEAQSSPEDEEPMFKAMLMNAVMEALEANRAAEGDALTPTRLARRYMGIEQQIRKVLQELSQSANGLLQEAKVLPNLPDAVLAAATEAELPGDKAGSPNMLNVLIEMGSQRSADAMGEDETETDAEEEEESRPRAMAHLVALNLKLSDIEFADTRLSVARNQLRQAMAKLKRMANKYQKKQRELSVAEAESAWRSVWYDD